MTRGRPLDLWSADCVLDFFLPSFILPSRASSSSPSSYIFREANPSTRSLARERIVRANRTSCARRRGHTALFVCHLPATICRLALSLNVRGRVRKKRTENDGEKRCQDVRATRCAIARGKFPRGKFDTRILSVYRLLSVLLRAGNHQVKTP